MSILKRKIAFSQMFISFCGVWSPLWQAYIQFWIYRYVSHLCISDNPMSITTQYIVRKFLYFIHECIYLDSSNVRHLPQKLNSRLKYMEATNFLIAISCYFGDCCIIDVRMLVCNLVLAIAKTTISGDWKIGGLIQSVTQRPRKMYEL